MDPTPDTLHTLGGILTRYLEDPLNHAALIANSVLVLDGLVELTDQETATLTRLQHQEQD